MRRDAEFTWRSSGRVSRSYSVGSTGIYPSHSAHATSSATTAERAWNKETKDA